MEQEWKSCPRCERTLEPGEEVCSYCGCVIGALDGEYVESMYDTGTLRPGTKPLIDIARTKTRSARIKILLGSLASAAILLIIGAVLNGAGV